MHISVKYGWPYLIFQYVWELPWKTMHILFLYKDDRQGMHDNFNDFEVSQRVFCEHLCLISMQRLRDAVH